MVKFSLLGKTLRRVVMLFRIDNKELAPFRRDNSQLGGQNTFLCTDYYLTNCLQAGHGKLTLRSKVEDI